VKLTNPPSSLYSSPGHPTATPFYSLASSSAAAAQSASSRLKRGEYGQVLRFLVSLHLTSDPEDVRPADL